MVKTYSLHANSGYYLASGEQAPAFADPLRISLEGLPRLDEPQVARLLQFAAHRFLETFLNGTYFSRSSSYLFPGILRKPQGNFSRQATTLNALIARGSFLAGKKTAGGQHPADLLAASYRLLHALADKFPSEPAVPVRVRSQYQASDYQDDYLWPVRALAKHAEQLRPSLSAFVLHGSMATLDYARGFSDLDTLLVIRGDVARDAAELKALQRRLYSLQRYMFSLDPLQHHGFFAVTDVDLGWYPQSFFPTELFSFAKSFLGETQLEFAIRDDFVERRSAVWAIVQWLRSRRAEYPRPLSDYELKLLVSFILLLPALVLQANGQPTYKKFSFDRLSGVFAGDQTVIREASRLRTSAFPVANAGQLFSAVKAPPPLVRRIGIRQMAERLSLPPAQREELLEAALSLGEDMIDSLPALK
jgi:hypothetical protein